MSWQAASYAGLAVSLAAGFAWYERKRPDARVVALVATLAAFAALGRIAFAAVPNVKPTTDIVLISGYALGAGPGFMVGSLAALSSNFFFGQGPWTPWQMAGWGATGLIGAGLALAMGARLRRRLIGRWPLAIVCGVVGFAFTALQDVGDWVNYSDHSTAQLAIYVGKGLGFDAVHAAGCVVFALALGPALARSVRRFATRLEVSWRPPVSMAPLLLVALLMTAPAPPRANAAASPSAFLVAAQNRDGGFGAARGQPSTSLYSGWVALGLASAGVSPGQVTRDGHSLTAYLLGAASSAHDPGSVERMILALRAAGASASDANGIDLVAQLEHEIAPDGAVSGQVNLTAFAVLALRAAGKPVPARTLAWIADQADDDGGFGYGPAGGTSDVDDTGAALEALAGVATPHTIRVRRAAVAFIRAEQAPGGGFPAQRGEDANAQSTAWAIQGLIAAGAPAAPIDRAIAYLRTLQASDGHIRYARASDQTPVWVTAEALMALERKPLPISPVSTLSSPRRGHRLARALQTRRRASRRKSTYRGRFERAVPAAPVLTLVPDFGLISALALAPIGLA